VQTSYAQAYRNLWERHWWWRSREAHVLGWVARLRRQSERGDFRILDVGCGDGLFFDELERFGTVEGLEADASIVTDPRRRSRIRIGSLGGDVTFQAEHDLVLMLDVLEHIPDDLGALQGAIETLRPGGRLLLTVPALPCLWSRHDEVNAHARRYDRRSLVSVLESGGFEVETVRYFFVWTVAPLLVRRWLAPASGRLAADYAVTIPPRPLNHALTLFSRFEHALGRVVRWPLGSSLLAVARPRRADS
jgi:SAM-dependent methyltransferase